MTEASMTEIRVSPDGEAAQRTPFDREDGDNWFCWVFRDGRIDARLLTDEQVAGWEVVWPRSAP